MVLDLGCADSDVPWLRDKLCSVYGTLVDQERLDPLSQFVKSFISSLTRDEVSELAYLRLVERYSNWQALAAADWHDIARVIADVTHPEVKARALGPALARIAAGHPEFSLAFLRDWPVERALSWLERLPGVGRKIAAATLNFSSLRRPAFVVDQHVLRVVRRFGLIGANGSNVHAYAAVMEVAADWDAFELLELHALMKHLGQILCRPTAPHCGACPLFERCARIGATTRATKKAALPPPFLVESHVDYITRP